MPNIGQSKKVKFGIIGTGGKHGSRLIKYLASVGEIVWTCNTNDQDPYSEQIEWVVISSPNLYHYEYAQQFLNAKVNVFLEKPATLSSASLLDLIDLAKKNKVHLYIDDVFLFRTDILFSKQLESGTHIIWNKTDIQTGSLLDRLTYHHLCLLSRYGHGDENIKNIAVHKSQPSVIEFSFDYCKATIHAKYQVGALRDENIFLGSPIASTKGEAIPLMLTHVFSGAADFVQNNALALWVTRQLEQLKKQLQPRVAVAGAGLFGCTAALELSAAGYQVDLYERHDDIIQEASAINQYRVHRGYHYPRSDDTVNECLNALPIFMKSYGLAVMRDEVKESFYAIASKNSKVSATEYLNFLNRHQLEYEIVENLPNTDLTVRVREDLFDPQKIKSMIKTRLFGSGVVVKCGVEVTAELLAGYDNAVVATYSGQNKFAVTPAVYQFELVEKPIFQLANEYRGRSVVILDGPFLCIDPYSDTPYHVMGNVVHAIHHTNTGYVPEIPPGYESVLNKGVIKNPPMSKIKEFLRAAKDFFPGIETAVHIGSMFTIRTVLPYRDEDDARPTVVDWLGPRTVGIFAGKICHSVAAAREAKAMLDEGRL
jgi:hypothetical protein